MNTEVSMTHESNPALNAQAAAIAQVIQQQADQAEAVMTAQGRALVEQMAAQAMAQAQANAAGEMVLHAQQLLSEMAGTAGCQATGLAELTPAEIEPARVIDLQVQPIALPEAAKAALPASARMLAAGPAAQSASAKRRARRAKAPKADQS